MLVLNTARRAAGSKALKSAKPQAVSRASSKPGSSACSLLLASMASNTLCAARLVQVSCWSISTVVVVLQVAYKAHTACV